MSLELSGTTGVKGVAGSVSAPSVVGDDTNTGISFPSADTIKLSTGGVERMSITNSGVSATGHILQVKNTLKTDMFSTNSTTFTDITGLSIDITASSSSNKFYISCIVFANCQDSAMLRLVKDGTVIAAGTTSTDSNPDKFQGFAFVRNNSNVSGAAYGIAFLDSPGDTSSHTYKVQGLSENGSSYALVVNRRVADTGFSLSSSITAMEVGA